MSYGFYGFDFSQNPLYSRLFSPEVINKGQAAYTQGMSQFTPYDARNTPTPVKAVKQEEEEKKKVAPVQDMGVRYDPGTGQYIYGPGIQISGDQSSMFNRTPR